MSYLLDTHVFLWMISEPERLSKKIRGILEDSKNNLFLSPASGLEIAIKTKIGKLKLPGSPDKYVIEQINLNSISLLPLTLKHTLNVYNLPDIHRDPFDRLLISQSNIEKIPIISDDRLIKKYKVRVIW